MTATIRDPSQLLATGTAFVVLGLAAGVWGITLAM